MGSLGDMPNFRRVQQFTPDYCPNTFTQYESKRTGMRVIVVDQEGTKVYGFFALATEIHDDSGAPHTLEHLCFMGSRSYQYKGFLDKLATRAYSSTNAWTETDHTAYTLETAGWAGFRQILPVYLEHVILPTLTDSGCLTEVHHVDGSGNDAGVVYSEMQGVQNTANELIELEIKRLIYPEGVGFRYETGGMMEQLRVLTAERIREFHREMYQPKNLCLILTGEVNHDELLKTLDEFEDTILPHIPDPNLPFSRPWMESKPVPALNESVVQKVEFPDEDDSFGQIDIRFLGPDVTSIIDSGALNVVLLYLAGSSAALLDNTLVEKEQLASGVYYGLSGRPKTEIQFSLTGVKTHQLEQVEKRFFAILRDAMQQKLDMAFLKDCLHRQVRMIKYAAEGPLAQFADAIIADYLFGKRDGSTLEDFKSLKAYVDTLSAWSESDWREFIKKYISDAHHVSILGVPSPDLSKKLKEEETSRIEEQKRKLGPDGLKRKADELAKAQAENDREIPSELLAKFKVPPTESIHFVNTSSARSGPALKVGKPNNRYQKIVEEDDQGNPLFLDFEHITSNFTRVNLLISTETVPLELRPLLAIYIEAFFSLPVQRDGEVINFEEVVVELERDTVGYEIELAEGLGNAECIRVVFQVENEKYQTAVKWLEQLLWNSIFDIERIAAVNSRLLANISDSKRSGDTMLAACHMMVHFAQESIGRAKCTLVKALYLKKIRRLLKAKPDDVVKQLQRLRNELCRYENFRVLVVTDLNKLEKPVSSWKSFLKNLDTSKPLNPLGRRLDRLSEAGKDLGKHSFVVPIPAIDSSFANAITRGPTSHDDPSLPALLVAMAYMNAVEGPLWVAVRGVGLAYGTTISYEIEAGFIYLDIFRSPDAYKAFEASQKVVEAHISGQIAFDPLMLEGAISSIVVSFANEQQTLSSAAVASFIRQVMRGLPEDYRERILHKVRAIEVDEIKQALKDQILPLFTPGKADILVTCAPGLQQAIHGGLESAGFKPEIHDLSWFQDDYGLTIGDGVDDLADDEDDDDDDNDGEGDDEDNDDEQDENNDSGASHKDEGKGAEANQG